MKKPIQLLFALLGITTLFSNCASLYTTPQAPTPFLQKRDGTAVQAAVGTNAAANFVSLGATKSISETVCINGSGTMSFSGNDLVRGNPYSGAKKVNQLAFNIGYNTKNITGYQMQIWAGMHAGKAGDSYPQRLSILSYTKDVQNSTVDSGLKFQKVMGNYVGTRLGITTLILSNYDGNFTKRARKKLVFDIVGTATYTPITFRTSNSTTVPTLKSTLLGYNTAIRCYKKNWILTLNLDNSLSGYSLKNEIFGVKNPSKELEEIPLVIPTLSYTLLFGKK
jgi:hypothetical protein